jgi:hypothetical protein
MITWHARVYNLRNTALPPHTAQTWVSPEHAGALTLARSALNPQEAGKSGVNETA